MSNAANEPSRAIQWRVATSLDGQGLESLEKTCRQLAEILRSEDPLIMPLREALAAALERDQTDEPGVRISVKGDAGYFKALGTVASEKRLLEAGRYIEAEVMKDRSYRAIYKDLPAMFGIADETDYGIRARKLFKEFREFCEARPELVEESGAMLEGGTNDVMSDEDYFYYSRAVFTEQRAGLDRG